MPFEQVPDLVATRRVLLRCGWAFVSRHEVASLVVGHFRAGLSQALALTARKWAASIADTEADRLTPIVLSLSERCAPPLALLSEMGNLKSPTFPNAITPCGY